MKKRFMKSFLAVVTSVSMLMTGITIPEMKSYASEAVIAQTSETVAASSNKYGLLDKACDGLILHCWNWSYNEIKNSMAEIAKAGYTSLQTSPVQMPKDAGSNDTQGTWWKVYQPTTLSMVNNHPWFGTKEEFKAMCDEAEKYGIKVIVDIVANHMANNTGGIGNSRGDICSQNDPTFRDDDSCWHLNGSTRIDYGNQHRNGDTTSLTWGFGGWPDLNTGSKKVQNAIVSLLKECVDLGADGFRFDAAKHIELPSDPGGASDFWPYVTSAIKEYKPDVYLYGEILDDSATAISNYTKYIAVTDNRAGNATSWGVNNHDIGAAANSSLTYKGELGDNIVLWAESHDTYANDGFTGPSTKLSQSVINRSWAIQAARDFAVLYYIRPGDTGAKMGSKSTNTAWKDSEVVEVNKFHNYFSGKSEYMSSYDSSVVLVERGSNTAQGGVVLVNIGGGSKNVTGAETHLLADGTYKDQVSGSEFKVSGGKISGNIGSTGVAVVYNKKPITLDPEATISQEGGEFTSDTLTLKLDLVNAISGTYKIGSQSVKTFTSAKSITIGADMAYGESVDIVLTATDGKTTSDPVTYTFTKVEKTDNIAYIKVPSGWTGDIYCYAYDSATEKVNNGEWPGEKMTYDSTTGYYKYTIPENIKAPRVVFYNSIAYRYPDDREPGLLFESSGSWLYADGKWSKMASTTENGTVIVKYVDESGNEIATSKKITGKVGTSYTTSAAKISGYTLKTTPANATGKYTASTITVKYIYSKVTSSDPTVTTSFANGSTFKTETQTIKLTLSNATSGTYSVDNGPVKTFTGSANVVLGQGKVADSTVTVKATATNASGKTKSYTFTYNKKFNGTVNEETSKLSVTNETASVVTAGQKLASNIYATNPDGKKGVEKTITIDGDASDWDESMLIAKGGAWDVANHYKGGHENCVLDTTALYAAYDNENLYIAWQMVNTTDTWARSGDGPLSDGGRVLDVPLILALSIDENSVSMSNKNTEGGPIWGRKMGLEFNQHVDRLLYMSGKPGLGKPSIFKAVDANGNTDYEDGCVGFADGGIEYKMATTNISSKIMGLNGSDSTDDIFNNGADWVDYKTFVGSEGKHNITYDSFYEIKIPYSTLGITKSTITSKGIKAMLVATRGESALDCIPYDASMLDNAMKDYSSDPSTSAEKDDTDIITADFAQIGGGGIVPPSDDLELNFGADRSAPQTAGTALTLKGIAQGGSANYTYKYYVNNKLVATKTGSGETSTSWTPQTAGTYTIKCVVTDSKNNTVTSAKKYTVESSGSVTTGWKKVGSSWYYYSNGKKVTGWKQINGKYYYFNTSGVMQASKWISSTYYVKADGSMAVSELVDNNKYYVDADGKWVKTTKWLKINNKWYYNISGNIQQSKWVKINNKWYYFNGSGVMQTSKWINKTYYVQADGTMAKSKLVDNNKYYVDADGKWVKTTKWLKINNKWYYNISGNIQQSKWVKINNKWYYFNGSGVMQTSKWIDGTYYVQADGTMAVSKWVDGGKYYVGSDGKWIKNK